MTIRSVKDLPVEGKRVFTRVDLNVPLTPARGVADDARIRGVLPTIRHLRDRDARVILASHLGRPHGRVEPGLTLEPVAARLADLLGCDVLLTDEPIGDGARKVVADLREGQIALLENLRFHPGEEACDEPFARALASYADVYVNDAFATAHRAHASTIGVPRHVATRGAGVLVERELEHLGRLLGAVDRPFVAVLGGARVAEKMAILEALSARADRILLGGAIATTFLAASGRRVGRSPIEDDRLALARSFLKKAEERGVPVVLPVDAVIAASPDEPQGHVVTVDQIPAEAIVLDVGPRTRDRLAAEIGGARAVFWNGPMGVCERAAYAEGTAAVARALGGATRALTVVVGADTATATIEAGAADRVTHLSTGGVAALEFLEGKTLPGLAALES